MDTYICVACGVAYPDSAAPPANCRICEDPRQFVPWTGQAWTTLAKLRDSHRNKHEEMEPGLVRIGTRPGFGIGQHAYVVQTPAGNVLWDCVSLLDDSTIEAITSLGGLTAIALSHPHYYSTIDLWSEAFDTPVYIHERDAEWIVRRPSRLKLWSGPHLQLLPELTLIHGGGHFPGSCMLHWSAGAGGLGALLPGDTIQVVHDRRWVSFMFSFMNLIPLSPGRVSHLAEAVEPYDFDRIYSPWVGRIVESDAKTVVRRSRDRYLAALGVADPIA
jgi:hypothetical protein